MPVVARRLRASEREEQAMRHLLAHRQALVARPEEVPMLKISRRTVFAALGTLVMLLPQAVPQAWASQQPTQFPLSMKMENVCW